jgi:hypothetical protein
VWNIWVFLTWSGLYSSATTTMVAEIGTKMCMYVECTNPLVVIYGPMVWCQYFPNSTVKLGGHISKLSGIQWILTQYICRISKMSARAKLRQKNWHILVGVLVLDTIICVLKVVCLFCWECIVVLDLCSISVVVQQITFIIYRSNSNQTLRNLMSRCCCCVLLLLSLC